MYRIEALRTERGMSQRQLADLSGVSQSSISRWEKEGTGMPLDKACLLANALHCMVDDLAETSTRSELLTVEEETYLAYYKACDEEAKGVLMQLSRYLANVD